MKKTVWERLAIYVMAGIVNDVKAAASADVKVSIRDNKAKMKIAFTDGKYTEICFHVDEFGIVEHAYQDKASRIWQDMMSACFGEEYDCRLASLNKAEKSI